MTKRLIQIVVCQLIATALWMTHTRFMRTEFADASVEMGKEIGTMTTIRELEEQDVPLPSQYDRLPNKDAYVRPGLGKAIHDYLVFWPALVLQGAVLVFGIAALIESREQGRSERSSELNAGPVETTNAEGAEVKRGQRVP